MASDDVKSSAINLTVMIPILTAIVAGLIALLSNLYSTHLNAANQIELEKQRLKANLILESVKTGDKEKAIENLRFFIEAGFIDDFDGKIDMLITNNRLPVLPGFSDVKKLVEELSEQQQEYSNMLGSLNKEAQDAIKKINPRSPKVR